MEIYILLKDFFLYFVFWQPEKNSEMMKNTKKQQQ